MFGENLSTFNPGNFAQWVMGMALFIIMIERALAQVFHTKLWKAIEEGIDGFIRKHTNFTKTDILDLKPWISSLTCILLVFNLNIDFFAFLFQTPSPASSKIATGLFVAGGSTGLVKTLKRYNKLKNAIHDSKIIELKNNKVKEQG